MRLTQIDGLRGIAALSVLLFHLTTKYGEFFHREILFRSPHGHFGVQLFFAISGFVILMTLTKIKTPLDFVVSRFSRLYPAFWAAMLVTALVMALMPISIQDVSGVQVAANALMFHGMFGVSHVDGVYWTLEAELLFYALMLLAWVTGMLKRPIIITSLWLCAALVSQLVYVPWTLVHLVLLHSIPWFALGITAYLIHSKGEDWKHWPLPVALSFACIWLAEGAWVVAFGALVFGLVIAAARGSIAFLSSKPLVLLGAISYSLYLIHQNVSYAIMTRLDDSGFSPLIAFSVAAGVSLFLAYCIHRDIEKPAMRFIRGWYKSPKSCVKWRWTAGIVTFIAVLAVGSFITSHSKPKESVRISAAPIAPTQS